MFFFLPTCNWRVIAGFLEPSTVEILAVPWQVDHPSRSSTVAPVAASHPWTGHLKVSSWWSCWELISGWWQLKYVLFCTPTWGNDPIWLIFFKWVETTNKIDSRHVIFGLKNSLLIVMVFESKIIDVGFNFKNHLEVGCHHVRGTRWVSLCCAWVLLLYPKSRSHAFWFWRWAMGSILGWIRNHAAHVYMAIFRGIFAEKMMKLFWG